MRTRKIERLPSAFHKIISATKQDQNTGPSTMEQNPIFCLFENKESM